MTSSSFKLSRWPALVGSLIFFLTGFIFLPYAGLQNDEVLPQSPLFRIEDALYHVTILNHPVPVMLMTYLGALKTWLYAPLFRVWSPSYLSVRLPALQFGCVTVWLFFLLLERVHSRTAAWIGMLLLATDSTFLLTTCFDWGPVALQHLLATAGILLIVIFASRPTLPTLAAAMFSFGLAFWDKALFVWLFGGLIAATLFVFPRELARCFSARRLVIATTAFCVGASPLIAYNVIQGYPTFHATSGFTTTELYAKSFVLRGTWEGVALFGYLMHEDDAARPRQAATPVEKASFWLRAVAGEHRRNGLEWALLAVLLCAPFLWRTRAIRPALFCAITILVAWLQMGTTKGAGAAAHHVVLLWPMPHLLLAVVFAQTMCIVNRPARWVFTAGITSLVVLNLLVTNQYFYQFARDGSAGSWTDAIYPLSDGLSKAGATQIAVIDWGLIQPLDVLNRGRLPLEWAGDPFMPRPPVEAPPSPSPRLLGDPQALWLSHTDGNEQFKGVNAGVTAFAERAGYVKTPVQIYYDRNDRPVFQTFRLRKIEPAGH